MNNLFSILKKYHLHPKSYQKKGKCIIIQTENGKYVLKLSNNYEIYNYLSTRGFNYYPPNYNLYGENYDLSGFIESYNVPDEQKIIDLITLLGILHNKTSFYQELDLDEIKEIYESLKKQIQDLLIYYQQLNDYLDSIVFLSPASYLLIRNISLIYYLLNYANNNLDIWYQEIIKNKSKRVALTHQNISIDHLLINEHKYLISWDKSKIDEPIYDLLKLYKKYYRNLELQELFTLYQKQNHLDDNEKKLLLILLAIPSKIQFTKNNLDDVKVVNEEIIYLQKVYDYIINNQKPKENEPKKKE